MPTLYRLRATERKTGREDTIQYLAESAEEAEKRAYADGWLVTRVDAVPPPPEPSRRAPRPEPAPPATVTLDEATLKRLARIIGNQVLLGLVIFTLLFPVVAFVFAALWSWVFA